MFFTRWVSHYCAPAFIFIAGTAAFLHGRKLGDRRALARFLLTRGAWLVLLELAVLRFSWLFNFYSVHCVLAGVIWVIGWCMILMAGLIFLPVVATGAIGVAIIVAHNITDAFAQQLQALGQSGGAWLWQILYFAGNVSLGGGEDGPQLAVLYSIVPWIGVMAAGYAFGTVMIMSAERRRRICFTIGGLAIAAFLVLRGFNLYGDPRPWGDAARRVAAERAAAQRSAAQQAVTPNAITTSPSPPATGTAAPAQPAGRANAAPRRPPPPRTPALLQFLGTAKYPASLLF